MADQQILSKWIYVAWNKIKDFLFKRDILALDKIFVDLFLCYSNQFIL